MLQERIQKHFKLPIEFAENVYKTPGNLVEDLELEKSIGDISDNTIYKFLLRPKTKFGKNGIMQWIGHYTTDIKFLQNHQNLNLFDIWRINELMYFFHSIFLI